MGEYNKAVGRYSMKVFNLSHIEETVKRERTVPFNNWLNERDSRSEICSRPNIDNWFEW